MWILFLAVLLPEIVSGQNQSCGSVGEVRVTATTAFTVSVAWGTELDGANCSAATFYNVCWTLTLSQNTLCLQEPTNLTSHTIDGLNPCINYTIEVTATTGGAGVDVTEPGVVTARTIPRSVFFVNATEVGPAQVRLLWLYVYLGNDCADQFLVAWTSEDGALSGSGYASTSVHEYTVSGLASCTNYTFSVATLDSEQRAAEPLATALTTDMLSSVLSVNTAEVSARSFDVLWTRPLDSASSPCSHWFQPCWGAAAGDQQQQQDCVLVERNVTSVRVLDREPCSEYRVSVATVSERSSHVAFWVIHTTPSENNTVISALHVVQRTLESVYLHWEPLYDGLPCAMAYRLCWSRQAEDNSSCALLHTDVTEHNVTNLQPRTAYVVRLDVLFDTDDASDAINVTVVTDGASGSSVAVKISPTTFAAFLAVLLFGIQNYC